MPALSLNNLCFSFGDQPLLHQVEFHVDRGERIGLLGRNGCGKSTLLRIMAGQLQPDDGRVQLGSGITLSRLVQELPREENQRVSAIVREGTTDLATGDTTQSLSSEWAVDQAVARVLSQLQLDGQAPFSSLSSGLQRRVLLAQALVKQPDVLLLDEPTNHLDIDSISWLERFLRGYAGCLFFVTHDRVFLQAVATRIMELDRGQLYDWTCDYQTFLKRRQLALDVEQKAQQAADRKLSQEEVWIRQGIKARRTRNEGRVRALQKMREEHRQRRQRLDNVKMAAAQTNRSGQLVIDAEEVSFQYNDLP
ncbi:MAG: ATP-binding cassette domain-containing protein, partial [Planctomycetaceae bacterium]